MQTSIVNSIASGWPGMLYDPTPHDVASFLNAEASAQIPFGVMVAKGTLDTDGILVAASGAKLMGVLLHSHVYDCGPAGELGTLGLKPRAGMNILRKGHVWVLVEEAVVAYDRAYVRYAAGSGGTQLGAFRKSAVSSETIDVTAQCQFMTSASAGGLAALDVDMLNT